MSNILNTIGFLSQQILRLEKAINKEVTLNKAFQQLLTVPCIGLILAMTIMLEVGDIGRFPQVGNFASYSRCVSSVYFWQACAAKNILTYRDWLGTRLGTGTGPEAENYIA